MMGANLSTAAKSVLGSVFGWGSVLTYGMQESVPSPEMQIALDELVDAGMLVREIGMDDMPAHGEAVRYRVALGVDVEEYRRESAKRFFDGDAPSIRVYIPRASTERTPS